MIPALALAATLLAASKGGCYLVGNKRIEVIPCNFDPKVIAARVAQMEGQPPAGASGATTGQANGEQAKVQARAAPDADARARQSRHDTTQTAPRPPLASTPQPGGAAAPGQAAPAAPAPTTQATPSPGAAPPATAQAPAPSTTAPSASQAIDAQRAQARRAADASVSELRALEPALASGSTSDAQAVLDRAAQALSAGGSARGAASVARAQEALSRGDLYAARQAIAAAIRDGSRR